MSHSFPDAPWTKFWAKTDRSDTTRQNWTHPLWAHLFDVGWAAWLLWPRMPYETRMRLAHVIRLPEAQARALLAMLVGLHDAGKAIPSFQSQHGPTYTKLGLRNSGEDRRQHHGFASIPIVTAWIHATPHLDGAPRRLLSSFFAWVGFHHGRTAPQSVWRDEHALGTQDWRDAQRDLVEAWTDAWMNQHGGWPDTYAPSEQVSAGFGPPVLPCMGAFAGGATFADWMGSMAEYVPDAGKRALDAYAAESQAAMEKAIAEEEVGTHIPLHPTGFTSAFAQVFATLPTSAQPRPLQQLAIDAPLTQAPTLSIVEAPTGEGKTEAALYLAGRLQARRDGRGFYVAMPTQATANGLFPRVEQFLANTSARAGAQVRLIHGASILNPDQRRLLDVDARAPVYTAQWFLSSKRSLLASYGVGTVDQALLGGLLSRHFFLRLFGLAGKTVIFDEVHAYDSYMSALFCSLLRWLRALGADVIVLSATLPQSLRTRMLEAWQSLPVATRDADAYPALTMASPGNPPNVEGNFTTSQGGTAQVAFASSDEETVVAHVHDALMRGAAVAVIVNMVKRAQAIYQQLIKRLTERAPDGFNVDADAHLLHARFPFAQRQAQERKALARFGKGRPSSPALLVATQVAEQSLDLDVDYMLSDLAPIDLLLQRAGRLHRHARSEDRPTGYKTPHLVVLAPDPEAPLPDLKKIGGQFEANKPEGIYLNASLWRTWAVLWARRMAGTLSWTLPDDYRPLVEAVYGPDDIPPPHLTEAERAQWDEALQVARDLQANHGLIAEVSTLPAPEKLGHLFRNAEATDRTAADEHNEEHVFRPVTRLGGPSVQIVCLHQGADERLFFDAVCSREAKLDDRRLTDAELEAFMGQSLRVSRESLIRLLQAKPSDPAWAALAKANYALAYHHIVVFSGGTSADLDLLLDPQLGLIYL